MRSALFFFLGMMTSVVSPWIMTWAAFWHERLPDFRSWLAATLCLGFGLGRSTTRPWLAGLLWGQLLPVIFCIPELGHLTRRVTLGGGCTTGLRFAWEELTALLFLLGAALGQWRMLAARTRKNAPAYFRDLPPIQ